MSKKITVEEFFRNNEQKIKNFKGKYLREGETIDECFDRIISEVYDAYKDKNAKKYKNVWKEDILNDVWRAGGGIVAATNNPEKKISVFNCTGFKIKEDTLEAIAETRLHVMKSAANRQGMGIDFSELRAKGSPLNNSAKQSEGVVNWMKSFDHIAYEVGQAGRVPAMLFSLRIDHPDILEFISCKDKLDSINNANISIQITDAFMEAVEKDEMWEMSFTTVNGDTINKEMKAKELLRKIAEHSHKSGEPGLQFIDNMKKGSLQEALGYEIEVTNACSEKPLPRFGVCCLGSPNLGKIPHIKDNNFKPFIEELTKSLVVFFDNVNEYEIKNKHKSPTQQQYEVVKDLREIGLGETNIHQWLYDQGVSYDSNEGIDFMREFSKWYFYYTFKASAELAKTRGACPAWINQKNKGRLESDLTPFLKEKFKEFPDLKKMYLETGIRNGALLSIAPTGTLSQTFSEDILSSGIEPAIDRCHWRKRKVNNKGNYYDFYFVIPDMIKDLALKKIQNKLDEIKSKNPTKVMRKIKKSLQEDYDTLSTFDGGAIDNNGTIGNKLKTILEKYVGQETLKCAHEIDPFQKIKLMSAVQQYVDGAISVTFNMPEKSTIEDIENLYIEAHKAGLKGLAIYRENCREGVLLHEFPKEKQVKLQDYEKIRPEDIQIHHAPKRPQTLECEIYNVLKHKVLVGILKDLPYEVFLIDTDIKLPDTGKIIKKSKTKYSLTDMNDKVLIDNIIDMEIINEEIKRLTRMTSLGLRHGVPIDYIIEQLEVFSSDEKYPKAVANVLKRKYSRTLLDTLPNSMKCEECGEILVKHEGCMVCVSCGMGGHCDF